MSPGAPGFRAHSGKTNPTFRSVRVGSPALRWNNDATGYRAIWVGPGGVPAQHPTGDVPGKTNPTAPAPCARKNEPKRPHLVSPHAPRPTRHDPLFHTIVRPCPAVLRIRPGGFDLDGTGPNGRGWVSWPKGRGRRWAGGRQTIGEFGHLPWERAWSGSDAIQEDQGDATADTAQIGEPRPAMIPASPGPQPDRSPTPSPVRAPRTSRG
jgi:hypothetical protein